MKHTDRFFNVRFNTDVGGIKREFLTHVEQEDSEQAIAEVQQWLETYCPSAHFSVIDCEMRMFPYLKEEDDAFLDWPVIGVEETVTEESEGGAAKEEK